MGDSYRLFPDPAEGDIVGCRAVLQDHAPPGLSLSAVRQYRTGQHKYSWFATYLRNDERFPSPHVFDLDKAKSILQRCAPAGARVGTVGTEMNENSVLKWSVIYFKGRTRGIVLKDFIPTKVFEALKPKVIDGTSEVKKISKTSRRPGLGSPSTQEPTLADLKDCQIRVKRNDEIIVLSPEEVLDTDIPQKIISKGIDVTRKYARKTRICRPLFERLFRPTPEPKPDLTLGERLLKLGSKNTRPKTVSNLSAVPFDYTQVENRMMKDKLSNAETLETVRIYLSACRYGLPAGYSKISRIRSSPILSRKLRILAAGLPADESLFKLYHDYAVELGIPSSEVIGDLENTYKMINEINRQTLF